jgi:hypothetical protein
MRLQLVLHQDFPDWTQTDLRRRVLYSCLGYASVNEEATWSESLVSLEEDLDCLLKLEDEGATAYREAPIFDNYSDSDDDPESFRVVT